MRVRVGVRVRVRVCVHVAKKRALLALASTHLVGDVLWLCVRWL